MLESIYLRCHVKLRFLKQFRWKSNEWKWVQFIHQHWNMPKFPEHSWLNENVNETTGENDKQKEKQKKCASLQWHRQWWRSNRCSVAMRLGCAFHRHHFGAAKQTEIVKWPMHNKCFNVDSVQRIMWHFDKNQENWTSSDDYTNGNYHYTHPIENLFTYNTSRVLRCFCLLWSTQYTNKLTNHRVNWTYQVYSYRCYQSRCDF